MSDDIQRWPATKQDEIVGSDEILTTQVKIHTDENLMRKTVGIQPDTTVKTYIENVAEKFRVDPDLIQISVTNWEYGTCRHIIPLRFRRIEEVMYVFLYI
jgi:hypothetical protein